MRLILEIRGYDVKNTDILMHTSSLPSLKILINRTIYYWSFLILSLMTLFVSSARCTLQASSIIVLSIFRGIARKYSTTRRGNCVFGCLRCCDKFINYFYSLKRRKHYLSREYVWFPIRREYTILTRQALSIESVIERNYYWKTLSLIFASVFYFMVLS